MSKSMLMSLSLYLNRVVCIGLRRNFFDGKFHIACFLSADGFGSELGVRVLVRVSARVRDRASLGLGLGLGVRFGG